MNLLWVLVIILLIVAFTGGWGYRTGWYGHPGYASYGPAGIGIVGIVLLVLIVLLLMGRI